MHWQPPTELLGSLRLPGADITNVDVPEVHRLIRQQQLPPGVAAKHLSVSVDAIRVTLEEHPAPRLPRRPPAPSTTVRRTGPAYQKASLALPRSRFVDLYEHQHASLRDIAATIGVSKQTVTELARDYRIRCADPNLLGSTPSTGTGFIENTSSRDGRWPNWLVNAVSAEQP